MVETKQPCVCLSGAAELAVSREDGLPLLPLGHLFGTHRGFNKRQAGTRLSLCRCTTLFQPSVDVWWRRSTGETRLTFRVSSRICVGNVNMISRRDTPLPELGAPVQPFRQQRDSTPSLHRQET